MKRASFIILALVAVGLTAIGQEKRADQKKTVKTSNQLRVDVLNGALLVDSADTIGSIIIERHYNSRSLYNGLFGTGWCSNVELRLKHVSENELQLVDCSDSTGAIPFTYNNGRHHYESLERPDLSIDRRGVRGFRLFGRNKISDFDGDGRLMQQGPYIFDHRNPGHIEIRRSDTLDRVDLQLDADQSHVVSAQSPQYPVLRYEVVSDRLKKVSRDPASETPAQHSFAEYQYDDALNLVHIAELTNSQRQVTKVVYNADLVSSVEDARCKKTLNYSLDESLFRKTAVVRTDCAHQPSRRQNFDFFYHLGPNSEHVLDSTKMTEIGGHS